MLKAFVKTLKPDWHFEGVFTLKTFISSITESWDFFLNLNRTNPFLYYRVNTPFQWESINPRNGQDKRSYQFRSISLNACRMWGGSISVFFSSGSKGPVCRHSTVKQQIQRAISSGVHKKRTRKTRHFYGNLERFPEIESQTALV